MNDPVFMPLVAISGYLQDGMLHVADSVGPGEKLFTRSSRTRDSGRCELESSPHLQENVYPVVATLDLNTVGTPPFRVVLTE